MFRELGVEAVKGFDGHLADHILATVREDDDEPIDDGWIQDIGCGYLHPGVPQFTISEGVCIIKQHGQWLLGYSVGAFWDEMHLTHIKTRGDFRTLCRLLGVPLKEPA